MRNIQSLRSQICRFSIQGNEKKNRSWEVAYSVRFLFKLSDRNGRIVPEIPPRDARECDHSRGAGPYIERVCAECNRRPSTL